MESSLCNYSNAYVLVTGDITVKNCAPFKKCRAEVNSTFVDEADFITIAMPIYNLVEYSNNYSDTSRSS